MTFTIAFGWWVLPTITTLCLFVGWRLFGIKMEPSNNLFPDCAGALFELFGYVAAALLSVIVWLAWGLAK